ncbi:hypothetical protein [Halobaculum litoreum]|uniref:hypothetical protein n=1 Tax=Halobaculum litoreum TaxID=3031998 RepID=UPI003D80B34A
MALLLVAVFRTLERIGRIDGEAFVLTAVPVRAAVVGLLVAETARLALWFGLPIAAVATAFALGAGVPHVLATGAVVALPMVCAVAVWGYAGGLALLRLFRVAPSIRRLVKVGALLGLVGLVAGSQFLGRAVVSGELAVPDGTALTVAPLAEYASLAFLGTPFGAPVTPAAVAVLVASVASVPLGVRVATAQASALWFADRSSGASRGRSRAPAASPRPDRSPRRRPPGSRGATSCAPADARRSSPTSSPACSSSPPSGRPPSSSPRRWARSSRARAC